jgi:GAF domain
VTTTDAGLLPLVLQLGRARAAAMDVQAVLTSVCAAVPSVLGVGGAVLLLVEPPDGIRALTASDNRALWFGEAQQRGGLGPLPGAVRTWRPMLTTDLARLGPPAIVTVAVECGLMSSLVLPFDVDGDRLGVLQLLGEAQRPVEAAHAEVLRPLLDVLAARLADVRALNRAGARRRADPESRPDATPPAARIGLPAATTSPGRSATNRRQASWLVPAPRATPSGNHADDEPQARRPPRDSQATPGAGRSSESTTSVVPTVLHQSSVSRAVADTAVSWTPNAQTPRSGKHSV